MRAGVGLEIVFLFCLAAIVSSAMMPAVRSGNYVMSGCGERNGELAALLSRLQQSLYTARQISTKSTVFEKFFHGVNPATVTRILSTIATGGDINFDGQPFEPTIICASSEMPGLADQWGVCQSPSVVASSRPGYRFVFLCPRFWGLLKRVPDALDCVGTLPNGHISVGQGLARTQLSILLHELVTIYIASAGLKPLHPQVWALHDVLDLPPTKSYLNPANYAFFVANTIAGCNKFEPPESLRPHERLLSLTKDLPSSPDCHDDPLAAFGGCPGVKPTNTFAVVTTIPRSAGSATPAVPPTA